MAGLIPESSPKPPQPWWLRLGEQSGKGVCCSQVDLTPNSKCVFLRKTTFELNFYKQNPIAVVIYNPVSQTLYLHFGVIFLMVFLKNSPSFSEIPRMFQIDKAVESTLPAVSSGGWEVKAAVRIGVC